jgi:hypothetical protein
MSVFVIFLQGHPVSADLQAGPATMAGVGTVGVSAVTGSGVLVSGAAGLAGVGRVAFFTYPPAPPVDPCAVPEQTDLNAPTTAEQTQAFVQVHMDQLVDLCQWGLSGSIITGLLMKFLSNHFSSSSTIMMPTLQQYLWTPDLSSKLRIANFTQFDPQTGQLPALVVKRADQTSGRKVAGDRNQATSAELAAGFSNFVRFIEGSHRIYVMSAADGEAEDLGDEVFDALTFLSPIFVELLPFHDFQVVSKGEIGVLDDLGNKLGIPITINYAYEYGWAVQPLAPRIKTFSLLTQ